MKINKKLFINMLMLCLSFSAFSKTKIIASIFPEYDWTKEIIGENKDRFDLQLLMKDGVDLHSFQPSVKDIAAIGNADIFIYVGGESDNWVSAVLQNAKNKELKAINLMEILSDKLHEEEVIEGMEAESECENEDEEEIEYDEHVWLSLKNTKILCMAITNEICIKDPGYESYYRNNLKAYSEKLDSLDKEFERTVASSKRKTLLFGDRFPFRYLTEDYGLKYYAAFTGCSAESEASFKTVAFLSKKLDKEKLPYVLQIENSNGKLTSTIIKNSKSKNIQVLTLNSMQTTSSYDIKDGANYLNYMKDNLESIKKALN